MAPHIDEPLNVFGEKTPAMQDKVIPIAVVGMSFRGPKDATSVENLWKMISERREAWTEIPKERWNNDAFYHPDHARHGTTNVKGGHFFEEDLSLFDARFFNMTSAEASALDPQQRLLLEGAFEAIENAGIPLKDIMGSKASCYVGSFAGDYTDMLVRDPDSVPMYQCTNAGQSRAITANRVSYFFDLKGPSVTVDTACSGSLVALHLACQSLRSGDAKIAFAAGVNTVLSHEFMSTMSMMRFLSPDGRCYTFDERANGYARGEGVGYLILKPLEDAIRDHDTIRAVIRNSGSNSDGRTSGITLPSGTAQEQLIRDVYEAAALDPLETDYVECHGTGTQAGDPQETGALSRIFSPDRPAERPLRIGSVKTNVGHLEGASGVAGVIKAVLMLENKIFLPNRNFEKLNPRIRLDEWKLKIQLENEPWHSQGPRRISVNSFGYGGSNAHVILEDTDGYFSSHSIKGYSGTNKVLEASTSSPVLDSGEESSTHNSIPVEGHSRVDSVQSLNGTTVKSYLPRLFTLSSFDETSGQAQVKRLCHYLEEHVDTGSDEFMNNLAFTLNERRNNFMWRVATSATSPQSLVEALQSISKPVRSAKKPTIGFVFTGQGAQWCGMGKELLDAYPIFSNTIDKIGAHLKSIGAPFDVRTELTADPKCSQINIALYSQPICSAVQLALVDLYRSWGIQPASVTGHSSGEIAAAYTAGALGLKDAMSVAYYRGVAAHNIQQSGKKNGAMMAVGMTLAEVEHFLADLKQGVAVVACVNSPTSLTISGDVAAIDELKTALDEKQLFARKLAVEVAYHSPHMSFAEEEYRTLLNGLTAKDTSGLKEVNVEFFSSVTGSKASTSDLGAEYWIANMVGQVKFAESLRLLCLETTDINSRDKGTLRRKKTGASTKATVDILVEIGPHSALAGPIKQVMRADPKISVASIAYASALFRKIDAVTSALAVAGSLHTSGYPLEFAAINRPGLASDGLEVKTLVDLPSYPWNHGNSYWAEPRVSKVYRNRAFPRTDLLGVLDRQSSTIEPKWRNHIRISEIPWIRDHSIQSNIVFPAAGYIAIALEAIAQVAASRPAQAITGYNLRDISIGAALIITEQSSTEIMTSLRPHEASTSDVGDWYEFTVFSVTDDNRWTGHCRGFVQAASATETDNQVTGSMELDAEAARLSSLFASSEARCVDEVDMKSFYKHLTSIGLEYGETFAGTKKARSTQGCCVADVVTADTASTMPAGFQYPLAIHPSTLDAILHSIFVALSADNLIEDPAIPTSIDSMFISSNINTEPGHVLKVCTLTDTQATGNYIADLTVVPSDASWKSGPAVSINGLSCTILNSGSEESNEQELRSIAYNLDWKSDLDLLTADQANKTIASHGYNEDEPRNLMMCEEAAYAYITKALSVINPEDLTKLESHLRVFYKALKTMSQEFEILRANSGMDLDELKDQSFLERVRNSGPEGELLCAVGEHLSEILKGDTDAWSVITAKNRLESYWAKTPRFIRGYETAARYLATLGHKNPHMSIIEIEAGRSGAALPVSTALSGIVGEAVPFASYTLTDKDASIFDDVKDRPQLWEEFLKFQKFDIESDLVDQGYQANTFDIVVLAHGTLLSTSRDVVLKNARSLLKPSGRLLFIDSVFKSEDVPSMSRSMIWGTLPAWWTSDITNVQTEQSWHDNLVWAGFDGLSLLIHDPLHSSAFEDPVMVANVASDSKPVKPDVLIVAQDERSLLLRTLMDTIRSSGLKVIASSFEQAQPIGKTCIVLGVHGMPFLEKPDDTTFECVKDLFTRSMGVLWVTRGGTMSATNPNASLVYGFARAARSETGDRTIVTLDLDDKTNDSDVSDAQSVVKLFRHHFTSGLAPEEQETEYAERDGVLMIPRVVESTTVNEYIASSLKARSPIDQPFYQEGRTLQAAIQSAGVLDSIYFADVEADGDVPDDFVDIEVKVCGLTYTDLQTASSQASSAGAFGSECSGVVRDVGKSVFNLKPGDRVVCVGTGLVANHHRDRASRFQKIPVHMSFEAAAAIPMDYCGAFHAVYKLARVERNEKVLVYNATRPYGQAIVELCKLVGAEILVTAATLAEKQFVTNELGVKEQNVLYSGDGNFTKGLLRLTDSKGADVILSTTPTSMKIRRQLWDCIAPYGRFIELCGRDLNNGSCLGMGKFTKDATFASFDVSKLVHERPHMAENLLADVMTLTRAGAIKGPASVTKFAISAFGDALRAMGQEQFIGKAVLEADSAAVVKALPLDNSSELLRSDASYLLVGGLGGIGRAASIWMLEHGARNIIFVNRSGQSKQEARDIVRTLEKRGAKVAVISCDVSDPTQVRDMTATASRDMPPIKGAIQAAMVLRDIMIDKMSAADYNAVVQPKFQGTWNLHEYLPQDMDFFIMLSSISGVIGNASQAAYASANTFMDAFSAYRNGLGLPAITLDLGVVTGIGYLSENKELAAAMELQGFEGTDERRLMALIESAIVKPRREGVLSQTITGLGTWKEGHSLVNFEAPLFAKFRRQNLKVGDTDDTRDIAHMNIRMAQDMDEATDACCTALSGKLAARLNMPAENIDNRKTVSEYGVDSLVAVEIRNWIGKDLECQIPLLDIVANQSLLELSGKIARKSKLVNVVITNE